MNTRTLKRLKLKNEMGLFPLNDNYHKYCTEVSMIYDGIKNTVVKVETEQGNEYYNICLIPSVCQTYQCRKCVHAGVCYTVFKLR
jgi:hypothetical protein